jgi:hypothetical protein
MTCKWHVTVTACAQAKQQAVMPSAQSGLGSGVVLQGLGSGVVLQGHHWQLIALFRTVCLTCVQQHLSRASWHTNDLVARTVCLLQRVNSLLVRWVAKGRHHHTTVCTVVVDVGAGKARIGQAGHVTLGDVLRL